MPKLNFAERTASLQKSKGYALARTMARRNAEIIRKYGARVGTAARQAMSQVTNQVTRRMTAARIGGKPLGQVVQQTGSTVRRPGALVSNAVARLQSRLEKSDAAVLIFTLLVIVSCIALAWLAVSLWNRF